MILEPDRFGLGRLPIATFRDALGFAMEFGTIHRWASAALVLDRNKRPSDIVVADGDAGALEAVISWASALTPGPGRPWLVLAVSARPMRPEVVAEADLRRYRQARWTLGLAGRDLIDWIETDGDLVRSYAYLTCPATAWAGDPPHHRLSDREPF